MTYPRKGSVFSFGVQVTPPFSAFKSDNFWLLSDREKNNARRDVLNEDSTATNAAIEAEIHSREQSRKYNWIEYHKWTFNGSWYTSLIGNLVLAVKAEFGYLGYSKFAMELRFPVSLAQSATIYGLAFFDGGNCWQEFKEFNPFRLKRSVGVGVRAFLPMFGVLGVDWGYGMDPQPGDTTLHHGSEFHFIMGQNF